MSVQQAGLGWEEFTHNWRVPFVSFPIEDSLSSRTERLMPMCSSPPTTTQSQRRLSPARPRSTPSAVVSQCCPPTIGTPSMMVRRGPVLSLIGCLDSRNEPRRFRFQEAEGVGEDLERCTRERCLRALRVHSRCGASLDLREPAGQRFVVVALGQSEQCPRRRRGL